MAKLKDVKIRMYRQGLGDCFLLRFTDEDEKTKQILIDCGVFQKSPGEREKMVNVAQNIRDICGGTLDAVVASHEHWDHVCGFKHAKDIFDTIEFKDVWMAWTEDPDNDLANSLRDEQRLKIEGLTRAITKLQALGVSKKYLQQLESILEFHGLGAAPSQSLIDIMAYLQSKAPDGRAKYFEPGKVFAWADFPGLRVYVLGPPQNRGKIRRLKSAAKGKLYHLDSHFSDLERLEQSVELAFKEELAANGNGSELLDYPFDQSCRVSVKDARTQPFFQDSFFEKETHWREIPNDWLEEFSDMAIQLDSYTNNTSLVLAFELTDSGKILLFPGDAQLGNWESWGDVTFRVRGTNGAEELVGASELLKKTVLYKVGHHGSHNATMQQNGLELMNGANFTALIPVNKAYAQGVKKWEMPFEPLLQRLAEKTQGRILEADDAALQRDDSRIEEVRRGFSWQSFDDNELEVHQDFIELTISA